jgi:hypothetical protein
MVRAVVRLRNTSRHHQTTPVALVQYPVRIMPGLPAILDAICDQPDDERYGLTLAGGLCDIGRDNEAAVVRVFWPTLPDDRIGFGIVCYLVHPRILTGRAVRGKRGVAGETSGVVLCHLLA